MIRFHLKLTLDFNLRFFLPPTTAFGVLAGVERLRRGMQDLGNAPFVTILAFR